MLLQPTFSSSSSSSSSQTQLATAKSLDGNELHFLIALTWDKVSEISVEFWNLRVDEGATELGVSFLFLLVETDLRVS